MKISKITPLPILTILILCASISSNAFSENRLSISDNYSLASNTHVLSANTNRNDEKDEDEDEDEDEILDEL